MKRFGEFQFGKTPFIRQICQTFLLYDLSSNVSLQEVTNTLCTAILTLSTITELAESTVVVLVGQIRDCVIMLQDSLTGSGCFTISMY